MSTFEYKNIYPIIIAFGAIMLVLAMVEAVTGIFNYPLFGVYGVIAIMVYLMSMIVERLKGPSIIIRPSEEFEAFAAVSEIIGQAQKYLKIIDPYLGLRTLQAINSAPKGMKIRFLTTTHFRDKSDRERVMIQARVLMEERPDLEVRSDISKKEPTPSIHDRYILTRPYGWKIGSSIRDLGKKLTSIDPMSIEETDQTEKEFDRLWDASHPFE